MKTTSPALHSAELASWPAGGCEVYLTMNGPSEFHVTGTFKDWSVLERLGEISIPTLVTCGRYDECTPEMSAETVAAIPGAELVVFDDSAHLAHAE